MSKINDMLKADGCYELDIYRQRIEFLQEEIDKQRRLGAIHPHVLNYIESQFGTMRTLLADLEGLE